jgi:hypothetical protein
MKPETAMKLISWSTAILVLILTACAFVLSFNALRDLAQHNGIAAHLAWMFPLVIDGFIIVASLSVVRNSLLSESALAPWLFVGTFTVLSIAGNTLHIIDGGRLAHAIAAVPPVALALAFKLLMSQLQSNVQRSGVIFSHRQIERQLEADKAALVSQIDARNEELARISALTERAQSRHQTELEKMRAERAALRQEVVDLSEQQRQNETQAITRSDKIEIRRQQIAALLDSGTDISNIASIVGVSARTVERDVEVLRQNGK